MRLKRTLDVRLIALCTTCILVPAIACPSQCVCKWKSGKRYVECTEKGLKSVPHSLDTETQVLDLTGNDLQTLPEETFQRLGLLDLQKIYMQRCRLQEVDDHAFKGLANLVELDLSNNYLAAIPSPNFVYFPTLMRLSLNNNPIASVKAHSFRHLSYLNTLEMIGCKVEDVEADAFAGLRHLEWLRLNGNRLTTVRGVSVFPDTLRGIDLYGNNWNCDCRLRDLHGWLLNFNMPHTAEPTCRRPERLRNRTIISVARVDLACSPKVAPTSVFLETLSGNNVTLECLVNATPEAKVYWLYQGQIIRDYTTHSLDPRRVFHVETGNEDKKSELFVYNIGADDNGTYSCVAENSAGRTRANYTLRILVKEEPVVIVVTFPHRHLIVIITVVFVIIVLLLAAVAAVLLKFKTDTRSRKKKQSGKDVALCNRTSPSSRGDGSLPKSNGSLIVDAHPQHALHYTVQADRIYECGDTFRSAGTKGGADRNPDLISDARAAAGSARGELEPEAAFAARRQVTWRDQGGVSSPRGALCQHSADVHLNPGCFLDSEGYPYDYGLPKRAGHCRTPVMSNYSVIGPFYQTLPHNRPKGQKLACQFAEDNEFNAAAPARAAFEMPNANNVRRTPEGYPVSRSRQLEFVGSGAVYYTEEFVPSPPEGYRAEAVQCCAQEACPPWVSPKGTCAVMVPAGVAEAPGRCYQVETRCVDTQTTDARVPADGCESVLKPLPQLSNAKCASDICSESPDEGYVGDANDI